MYEGGYISEVKCGSCSETFPVFTFSADTDMLTHGCVALTGMQRKDIVLTMMQQGETTENIKLRIGLNYKIVAIRYEQIARETSCSFQDFLKTYRPLKATYSCIYCEGDCVEIFEESKEEFLTRGIIEVRDAL
jgi:hypothetical protein